MGWPPQVGELLPRAQEAFGVRYKLATYSLAASHRSGGAKARGFELILGITLDSVTYLEAEILSGILIRPITAVRGIQPFGITCVVDCPIRGIGAFEDRVVPVRTAWIFSDPASAPRLTSAYLKP
jgi:hypothetical protein